MCYQREDKGFYYRGSLNVTHAGPCQPWDRIYKIDFDELYDYVGLEDSNACRNSIVLETLDKPWCYSGGQKVECSVPACESNYEMIVISKGWFG